MKKYLYYKIQYFLSVFLHQLISVVIDKTEPFAVISFPLIPKGFPTTVANRDRQNRYAPNNSQLLPEISHFVCRFQCAG